MIDCVRSVFAPDTYQALTCSRQLLPIITLTVLASVIFQLSISRRQNRDIEQDEHHSKMRRRNGRLRYPADRAD